MGLPADAGQRLATTGMLGFGSGLLGGAAESTVITSLGSAAVRTLVNRGAATWFSAGFGRAIGGFASGGIAAPVFTIGYMAVDGQPHTSADYAAIGTRALVSGTLSGALAAGVTGAIFGSEVPIAGNIVGFIIGFGGYLLVDALLGDSVEQRVHRTLDR